MSMPASSCCPDCGTAPGDLHLDECDIERCPYCVQQLVSCDCRRPPRRHRIPWTGEWPGEWECREWGWVTADGQSDIRRLVKEAWWDWRRGRFVRR
jgi:hypothetical protein